MRLGAIPLMGLRLLRSSASSERPCRVPGLAGVASAAPPMRFLPLQRFPARGSSSLDGLASPVRLRPQVFSTSRRFHPPHACRRFRPDPLLGFCPSERSSSRAAVHRLRCRCLLGVGEPLRSLLSAGTTGSGPTPSRGHLQTDARPRRPRLQGLAPRESLLLGRAISARGQRMALLGFLPSRALPLVAVAGFCPSLPSWVLVATPGWRAT